VLASQRLELDLASPAGAGQQSAKADFAWL